MLSAPDAVDSVSLSVVLQQVPTMTCLHEGFAREVEERLEDWSYHQCLGDLFLSTVSCHCFCLSCCIKLLAHLPLDHSHSLMPTQFTKKALVDAYSNFIQHFLRAKAAIALAKHTSPALTRALEVSYHGD